MSFYLFSKIFSWGSSTSTTTSSSKDGIVEGDDGANNINTAYTGDPNGDFVDANDVILGNVGSNDDIILAGGGNDTVLAGEGNDTVFGGSGDDKVFGENGHDVLVGDGATAAPGNDTLSGGEGNDLIYGDNASNSGVPVNTSGSVSPVAGADYTLLTWDLSDVSVSGGSTPFEDSATGSSTSSLDGKSFVINGDATPLSVGVNDHDDEFEDGSGSPDLAATTTINGRTEHEGDRLTPEYAYTVRPADAVDGSQDLKIYVVEFDGNKAVGFVSDKPLEVGKSYDFINKVSDHPSINYSELATTYTGSVIEVGSDSGDSSVGGDDVITGGNGNDTIFGEGGNDEIDGGAHNDVIYGDTGNTVAYERESFEWDKLTEHQIDSSVVQDTGNVDVTYTRTVDSGNHDSKLGTEHLNTVGINSGGETVDDDSSLSSITNGEGNIGEFQWAFSAPVADVSFNINDLDQDGLVKIYAFDADDNPIPVSLSAGYRIELRDEDGVPGAETADSKGGGDDSTSARYTVNVDIPGPVSRIVVNHTQDGYNNSGINITDMYFDAPTGETIEGGDDSLIGGEGNDTIFGEGGDDTMKGDAGEDYIEGNAGDNEIHGGTCLTSSMVTQRMVARTVQPAGRCARALNGTRRPIQMTRRLLMTTTTWQLASRRTPAMSTSPSRL